MESQTFYESMSLLSAFYGDMSDSRLKIYYKMLKDIPDGKFQQAIKNIIETHKYNSFPTIADIKNACGDSVEQRAHEAIMFLKNITQKIGSGDNRDFGDKVLNAVVNVEGLRNICYWDSEKWGFEFKRLVDLYKILSLRGEVAESAIGAHKEDSVPYTTILTLPPYMGGCDALEIERKKEVRQIPNGEEMADPKEVEELVSNLADKKGVY